ncbi:MAG TPA: ABC transporter permease [Vicinamibacterales bacterium]|nr:ABC transporter permease [Vicinamibacterales bacterium]
MRVVVALMVGLKSLQRQRLRTVLTMLGMVIGVAAVIAISAIGVGAQQAIEDRIESGGANMLIVLAGNRTIGGVRLGMGASSRLTAEDADAIRALPNVAYVSPGLRMRAQIVAGGQNWNTSIEGGGAEMPQIHDWQLEAGTFFTARDVQNAEKFAVLGSMVRDTLFGPGVDPLGRIVRAGIVPLKVIGVLASKGQSSGGQDQDDTVFVPYTTVQRRIRGVTYLDRVTISARTSDSVPRVEAAVTRLLRQRHEIMPGADNDFRVANLQEIAQVRASAARTMTELLTGIAAVALLIGGVGIMNIMLVAVTERTREIGIRTAIGARSRDVLLQFLLEAFVISAAGAAVGVLAGFGAADAAQDWLGWRTAIRPDTVILAVVVSLVIGVVFGFYPAAKASRLDPIDALRFE